MALVVGLVGAAGCSDDAEEAVPFTTTSGPDATTTSDATTTTLDFETEVKRAAIELLELRNEVFMNPDPTRVEEYISETCVCLEAERGFIEQLATNGERWAQPPFEVLAIRLERADQSNPRFTVVARQPGGSIAGPESSTSVTEVPVAPLTLSLVRDDGARWRINSLDEIPLAADVAQRIIDEEGLP